MTAPAIPAPSVPTPIVPPSGTTSGGHDLAPLSSLADRIIGRVPADPAPPPVETPAIDAPPTEVAPVPATSDVPVGDAPAESVPTDAEGAEAAAAPDQATLERGVDLGTGDALFRVRDSKSGQFIEAPDLMVDVAMRDKATGEVKAYQKSIPELARMARDGVAGQRVLGEHAQLAAKIPELQTQLQEVAGREQSYAAMLTEMLSDPTGAAWERRVREYQAETAPDRVAAREVQSVARERDQLAQQLQTQQRHLFYSTRIQPVIEQLTAALGPEVVLGKIQLETARLNGLNGQIPPDQWPALDAYVNGPLKTWGEQQIAARTGATASADAERRREQANRNATVTAARPTGRPAGTTPAPLPPAKNINDIADRIVARAGAR